MLDHVIELIGFLRMALFHGRNNIHHASAGVSSSWVSACTEKYEFCDISIIEAHASPVRPAIFPHLEPDDIRLVLEALGLHGLKTPREEGIGAPKIEMRLLGGDAERARGAAFQRDILSRIGFGAGGARWIKYLLRCLAAVLT
jgi:hypothetical protein